MLGSPGDSATKEYLEELKSKAQQIDRVALLFESLHDSSSESEEIDEEKLKQPLGIEQLRAKKHALVTKACHAEISRIQERMETEGAPNGFQSTSTCVSMYRVFANELRRANGCFDNLLALTLAFKDDMGLYCFHDTDIPEEAQKLLTRFGKLWQDAIRSGLPLDDRSREGVMFVLQRFQESIQEMDADYQFAYEPRIATPKKRGRPSATTVPSTDEKACKRPKVEKPTAEKDLGAPTGKLAEWLHRRDHELKKLQDAAVQIICKEHGGSSAARALVISAAHPLRSLSNTLGAAFGLEGVIFDPHQNKGQGPAGAVFIASADGEAPAQLPLSMKVIQALQERGNTIKLIACGRSIECTLDGVVSNKDDFRFKNDTHLPRCVGADGKSLGKISKLNTLFMAGRQPGNFLGCTKAEARKATVRRMSIPLTVGGTPQSKSLLDAPREGPITI
mmetsp:Transcript_26850/g.46631  ORF Transcript_26850/g.46631 Transcript_26850/m.46631 type:complete len:449 (-) Transcript_26850:155-1501(-)